MALTLVNRTFASARARAVEHQEAADTYVITVTAKLTLKVDPEGNLVPDVDAPIPFFEEDCPTPLGVLPRDDLDRPTPLFQVLAYGHACAYSPTAALTLGLRVGEVSRELVVVGERYWVDPLRHIYSTPQPFERMPLTFDRCFGGRQMIQTSVDSALEMSWPLNPAGKGFDALAAARPLSAYLQADASYPRGEAIRWLPNIEDPHDRIEKSNDEPMPPAWAALPTGMALHFFRNRYAQAEEEIDIRASAQIRAHPCWLIAPPTWPLSIELANFGAPGLRAWNLSPPRFFVDVEQSSGQASLELQPMMLQIFADEGSAVLLYQTQWATKRKDFALRLRAHVGS
jgi:hypothetical protein